MPKLRIKMRLARLALGLTLDDLGMRTRPPCSGPLLSLIENGRRSPSPELARELAGILGLRIQTIFPEVLDGKEADTADAR